MWKCYNCLMNNIPKIIHYCWFGGKPLPESAIKCINSWKKYCPDYEIIEWNEKNFPIEETCDYVKEAYSMKKWAFVSDYVRFEVIYKYGGLYFDTDVEIIKPIDDLIQNGPFFGLELNNGNYDIQPGLGMGAEKGNAFYKKMLDDYRNDHYILENNQINTDTVVDRTSRILKEEGYNPKENTHQFISGINIYPLDYFCPMDYNTGKVNITENTYSIHWYDMSWLTEKEKKWQAFSRKHNGKPDNSLFFSLIKELYCHGIRYTVKLILNKLK